MENTLLVPQCGWHRRAQFWTVKSAGLTRLDASAEKMWDLKRALPSMPPFRGEAAWQVAQVQEVIVIKTSHWIPLMVSFVSLCFTSFFDGFLNLSLIFAWLRLFLKQALWALAEYAAVMYLGSGKLLLSSSTDSPGCADLDSLLLSGSMLKAVMVTLSGNPCSTNEGKVWNSDPRRSTMPTGNTSSFAPQRLQRFAWEFCRLLELATLALHKCFNAGEVPGPKALVGAWSVPNFGKGDENQDRKIWERNDEQAFARGRFVFEFWID